jgi:hypothetical protein
MTEHWHKTVHHRKPPRKQNGRQGPDERFSASKKKKLNSTTKNKMTNAYRGVTSRQKPPASTKRQNNLNKHISGKKAKGF